MKRELTELEQCVVGVVWRDGPMTAYEIAALFSKSLSPYWSGSAGAIYPLVKRLQHRGLLRGTMRAWNGARKTVLTITPKGKASLRVWLTPPIPSIAAAPTLDPIRTRMFFLEILSAPDRLAFLDDAERITNQQIELARQQIDRDEAAGQMSEVIGAVGVIYELKGRVKWLNAVREYLTTNKLPR
jgi:DNA-binding PadR family transcriptional regulator